MKAAVVGGKLQGVEATYLAHQLEWQVILIDKNPLVPASGLCDQFLLLDVARLAELPPQLNDVEFIIPALEDEAVLNHLYSLALKSGIPFAYDPESYQISSSKNKSDALFAACDIPAPKPWPHSAFPLIAKPCSASGSRGVRLIKSPGELQLFRQTAKDAASEWVIQEYMEGPSYSIEVLGLKGKYITMQTTLLEMDQSFDCKRVLAPANIDEVIEAEFIRNSQKIARCLQLSGIMDVECIYHNQQMKILEIDARLPSQTPTAVYHSTGINMLDLMYQLYHCGELPNISGRSKQNGVIYEHIRVTKDRIEVLGEHIMATAGPLKQFENFFGADFALANYSDGCESWAATLIFIEKTLEEAWAKHHFCINQLMKKFKIAVFLD